MWIKADWPAPTNVCAGVTTRMGGYSLPPYDSFNLANGVGDQPNKVRVNRALLKKNLNLPAEPVWLKQVHDTTVIAADKLSTQTQPEADASFSQSANIVCAVLVADCLPLLVCNKNGTEVAAIHAGWRGLAAGVIENTIASLHSPANQLLAWLGPAIGPEVFEVGEEVYTQFTQALTESHSAFRPSPNGRWVANIYILAQQRLSHCGITAIFGGNFCTYTQPQQFFSYRRDKQTGRMASLIWFE